MAKYYGNIGFASTSEVRPGVWKPTIVEYPYYGDILDMGRRLQSSDKVNDNITISDKISIVADPFARENFYSMKWIEYAGAKWKVSSVSVSYPRLILTLGELYNESTGTSSNTGNNSGN